MSLVIYSLSTVYFPTNSREDAKNKKKDVDDDDYRNQNIFPSLQFSVQRTLSPTHGQTMHLLAMNDEWLEMGKCGRRKGEKYCRFPF